VKRVADALDAELEINLQPRHKSIKKKKLISSN